jgi:hypothetical protein
MRYKALVSFVGAISMAKGEVRELPDSPNVNSLINAKYIEAVEEKPTKRKRTMPTK